VIDTASFFCGCRWLLFLRHCAKCQAPDGSCQYGQSCTVAKQLWRHILTCSEQQCSYPRCAAQPQTSVSESQVIAFANASLSACAIHHMSVLITGLSEARVVQHSLARISALVCQSAGYAGC